MNYLNERKRFTPEQITGIMFTKLKQIINSQLGIKPVDCVIGVRIFNEISVEQTNIVYLFRYLVILLMLNDEHYLMLHK